MPLLILNDIHLGSIRVAGTTPASAYQLRQDLIEGFERLVNQASGDLMLLGDLFDGADIPRPDMLAAFRILSAWLTQRPASKLYAVAGNHDLSRSSQQMSAFQLLGALLMDAFPSRVMYVEGSVMTPYGYVISHMPNQDLYNLEVEKVPACDYLFTHVNYNNLFAQEADHSLNLSETQARTLPVRHVVFAHEHQQRAELDGKVIVIGNNICASISDCLGNTSKRMMIIEDDGSHRFVETWRAEGDYQECDWRELEDGARFVRAVGTATAEEAATVMQTIARFRAKSSARVVGNAVKIASAAGESEFELTHEQITEFNVREALREFLTEDENKKVDALLAPADEQEKTA